jgi:hypothetical protein
VKAQNCNRLLIELVHYDFTIIFLLLGNYKIDKYLLVTHLTGK